MVTRPRNSNDRGDLQAPLSAVPDVVGSARRLATILCADIKDYSRLVGMDEEGTLSRVKRIRREVIDPTISEHHGRLVKSTGDGVLAMFDSPVEAVRCAIVIQQSMVGRNTLLPPSQWIQFRIGVNLGDVVVDPDDIYGDGVNIAARLQTMAQPGGVYISGGVYEQIKNKLVCGYQSLGDEKLKNITDPVRVYRVVPDPAALHRGARYGRAIALIVLILISAGGAAGWYVWPSLRMFLIAELQAMGPQRQQQAARRETVTPLTPPSNASEPDTQSPVTRSLASPPELKRDTNPPEVKSTEGKPAPPPATTGPLSSAPVKQADSSPKAAPVGPTVLPAPPRETTPSVPKPAVTQQAAVIKPPQRPPMAAPYEVLSDCGQCPELVKLPGGKFHMGSNDDPTERPIHQVTIAPFAIGRFAVTIGEWKQCVAAKACDYELKGDDDIPAHNLSWNDAKQYVTWLSKMTGKNYRLPTEAEWEYAARGGTTTRYWWGNAFERGRADCEKCGEPYDEHQPLKVGSFPANPFGLHDMAGGVLQWVLDCWHNNYSGAPTNSSSWEAKICHQRVLRGGSWKNDSSYARASSRDRYDPAVRYWTHGLRVARSL